MPLPTSTFYDVFDWNSRYANTTDATDRSLSDGVDPITAYVDVVPLEVVNANNFTTLVADATNIATSKVVDVQLSIKNPTVGSIFTIEFDVILTADMPTTFSDIDNRLFVGAMNGTGLSAGFLFSYQGMALASYPEDPNPIVLGGSASFMFGADGLPIPSLTVRGIVDEDSRITVYAGATSEAYDNTTGVSWADLANLEAKYNMAAKASNPTFGDAVLIHASAQSAPKILSENPNLLGVVGEEVSFSLGSLRLSSVKIIPVQRPVASVLAVKQVLLREPLVLNGSQSMDPLGNNISYNWEISAAPAGSAATLTGATYSETLSAGVDLIGTDVGKNKIRFSFKTPTLAGDDYSVVIANALAASSPLTMSMSGTVLTVTTASDATNTPTTTANDLLAVFNNSLTTAYDATAAELFTLSLQSPEGTGVLPAGTYALSGGNGSAEMNPTLISDKAGTYVVSLIVDNGTKKSKTVSITFLAAITDQLIQHRPNSDYIFNYLPDFWNLVQDNGQLPALWSAVTQAVASDTVIAWQNDYSKALKDIARRYQRRWLAYDLEIEVENEDGATLVLPDNIDKEGVVVLVPSEGTHVDRANIINPHPSAPYTTGKFLFRSDISTVEIIDVIGVENTDPINGFYQLRLSAPQIPAYKLLGSNNNGLFREDPSLPAVSPKTTNIFTNVTYSLNDARQFDVIRTYENGAEYPPVNRSVITANPQNLDNTVETAGTAHTVDGINYSWEHLRPADSPSNGTVERTPYFSFPTAFSLSSHSLGLGDYVKLTVLDPYSAEDLTQYLPVLAVDRTAVFVDWDPMLQALNLAAAISAEVGEKNVWTIKDLSLLTITLESLFRHKKTVPTTDLVSIPKLGETTISSELAEGTHYDVTDTQVVFRDYIVGEVICKAGSEVISFVSSSTLAPGVDLTLSYDDTIELGLKTIVITEGNAGVYSLVGKGNGNSFHLDKKMTYAGTYPVYAPRYGAYTVSKDNLWAEVSYFDNCKQIESNFGLLVGMPKYVLEGCDISADYLSVVKSLWFAFVSGPSMGNIQLATQAFFGLLFAEVAGQITIITEPTETVTGSITLTDSDGRTYTYDYPYGATLALNPTTARTVKAFPITDPADVTRLSAQAQLDLADAQVPAYAKFFDVVKVEDYISDPVLIEKSLPGPEILKKYHTFVVDVPLTITNTTSIFSCVKTFLNAAKPAYTDFILLGSLPLNDFIDVQDTLTLFPSIKLRDTPHSSAFSALKTDAGAFGQPIVTAATEYLVWPHEKTTEKFGHVPGTTGSTTGTNTVTTSVDLTEYIGSGSTVKIASDHGTAVAGYETFSVTTATATLLTLGANYLGTSATSLDTWASLDSSDVKERYESGYSEGILDDFSGDGSWNKRYQILDTVNNLDSDIDVVNSLLWVPVTKLLTGDQNERQFIIGEEVDILDDIIVDAGSIWAESPAHVVHIGSGLHPEMPFGVYMPQHEHPETYLILGFETEVPETVNNYGHEDRLDAIAESAGRIVGPLRIKGRATGAIATPVVTIDRTNVAHAKYFLTETIFQADKLTEWNPKSDPGLKVTRYLPIGGTVIDELQIPPLPGGTVEPWNTDSLSNPEFYLQARKHSMETQQYPYDSTLADASQFVPSLDPGMYMDWDLSGEPGPPTKASYAWRYGFTDVGDVLSTPTARTAFTPDANSLPVENTHVGMKVLSRKTWHYTHGFTEFYIPPPVIKLIREVYGGSSLRIEGHYFVNDDPTRVAVPSDLPSSFDGTGGGSWVFMREISTGTEIPLTAWTFETGFNIGKTVLGAHGVTQTSTGHVLEFVVPVLPSIGWYDIIVRNYRPWKMHAAGAQLYHMDEAVAEAVYLKSPGYSGVGWGTGVWGGV